MASPELVSIESVIFHISGCVVNFSTHINKFLDPKLQQTKNKSFKGIFNLFDLQQNLELLNIQPGYELDTSFDNTEIDLSESFLIRVRQKPNWKTHNRSLKPVNFELEYTLPSSFFPKVIHGTY